MRKIFLWVMLMLSIGVTWAEEADAVFCWVNGTSTCYRLEEMPVVRYENGAAVLTIRGVEQLRVAAESIENLTVAYGVYQATDIESVEAGENTPVQKVGKYIIGGRLIIVKDGVMYDVDGHKL